MKLILLTLIPSANYDLGSDIRKQRGWEEHAAYMDDLTESGFIAMGGPVGNGWARLLVLNAKSEAEVHSKFKVDPWIVDKMLSIAKIETWDIWLQSKADGDSHERDAKRNRYIIKRRFGPNWNHAIGIREQEDWEGHAEFMDAIAEEGLVLLGGPIDKGPDIQLIGNAAGMQDLLARLSEDPWRRNGLLEDVSIEKWQLLLGKPSV